MILRRVMASLAGAAVIAWGVVAWANHAPAPDPNDARGPFDIRRVEPLGEAAAPRWVVTMWREWRTARVRDRGFVLVYLDTFGSDRPDYYALVRSTGRRIVASLWRDREKRRDVRLRGLDAGRPSETSLAVKIPLRALTFGDDRTHYNWRVQSLFNARRCPHVCFDFVPDAGAIFEPRPGANPTPSFSPGLVVVPTLTPSPSPSMEVRSKDLSASGGP